jgi:polysaccharide biosynthesis/export protein
MELPMTRNSILRGLHWQCLVLLICIGGASSGWGQTDPGQPQAASTSEIDQAPKISIGPGDQLTIDIFDTPELSSSARVSQNGEINLNVIGSIEVAGLTASQAARRIESELKSRGLLIDPHVTVSISEYASQGATVTGEVHVPGLYPTLGSRRLLEMLALAGGVSSTAGKDVTIIHRGDPQHPVNIALVQNINALSSQQNPIILPGDTIVIGKAGIIYILGAVAKPGGYLVDNNEHLSLLQAITLAGGWATTASLSQVRLVRKVPEGREEIKLDLKHVTYGQQADITVNNNDILFVPSSVLKTFAYQGIGTILIGAEQAVIYATVAK